MPKAHSRRAKNFHETIKFKRQNRSINNTQTLSTLRKAVIEALEVRTLMSGPGSAYLSGSTLVIQGNATQACSITADLSSNKKNINIDIDNGSSVTVFSPSLSSVKAISLTGGSGSDYIYVDAALTVPTTINGGQGNDSVRGDSGFNTITEGDGNVWINSRGSSNYIKVGNGKDTVFGSAGNDTIVAGNGNDTLDGAGGNDQITAGDGNDTITGGAGNDTLVAGNGNDVIDTGTGNNKVTVGAGASTIIPGTGANYIVLGSSKSIVKSSSGSTTVVNASGQTVAAPTSTNAPTYSTSWVSFSAPASTGTSPQAVLQVLAPAATVGIAVDTRALNSKLGVGSPIDANYQWNFGDPSGEYNTLSGFNSTHIYTVAGTYTITLTVTNSNYQSSTVSTKITITPDTRKVIYVNSTSGNDYNNGLTPATAIQSIPRAQALLGNNTELLFARGQVFNESTSLNLLYHNVLVGAYGSGAQPIINYTAPAVAAEMFSTNATAANGITIQDLTMTTLMGKQPTVANMPHGVMAGGFNTAVLRCTFDYVQYDICGSGKPVGLTVEDNDSPINGGLQGYFVWDQGTDVSVIGNTVNGSVHEHILRTEPGTELLVTDNYFSNFDGKGCIEVHAGGYAWVDGNTCNSGDIRVGPLGLWGEAIDTTNMCVIQNNRVNNSGIAVFPGATNISIRNNIITRPSNNLIDIRGQDGLGRQSANIHILNNTGFLTGSTGTFLDIESHTLDIFVQNNLLVAPSLTTGAYGTAVVYVDDSNLSDFDYINGNVWQLPKFYSTAHGGVNWVGTGSSTSNYETPAVWNAQSVVGTDYFSSTPITASDAPASGSLASSAATAIPGVFADIYGVARSTTGKWAAGAV
jgi:Ca2+-binding RTX toxin-like protein